MQYNSVLYQNRAVKFTDFITNKYNVIHNKLYIDALNKYMMHYIDSIVSGKFLHRIFQLFNVYFVNHTEQTEEDIIDIEAAFSNLSSLAIIPLDNILNDDVYNDPEKHLNDLTEFMASDEVVLAAINKLQIFSNNKKKYIKFIIVNILYFIYCLKRSLSSIENWQEIIEIIDITDFIITYKNNSYIIKEGDDITSVEQVTLIQTEYTSSDIMLAHEYISMGDIHIGYTENGTWIIDISNEIDLSDDELRQLLSNLIKTTNANLWNLLISNIKNMYMETHRIIEQKAGEYWQPSKILIITTFYPYTKEVVDLSPWWNDYQEYKHLSTDNIIANETSNMIDAKVQYIDYVRGKTKVYSKTNDITKTLDLNYIHADTEIDEESTLANTFAYKLNQIR